MSHDCEIWKAGFRIGGRTWEPGVVHGATDEPVGTFVAPMFRALSCFVVALSTVESGMKSLGSLESDTIFDHCQGIVYMSESFLESCE